MDAGTAQKYGFGVGQTVRILSAAGPPRTFTITGIAEFGTANNLAGATLAAFTLPTAQALAQETGKLDAINVVAAPGADKAAVQRAIARALPPGAEVVTGQTVADENTSSVNQALSFFSTALLVFAFISLFVGAFTIYNTFSIIVGQRTRELALLRIVGASRRQVFGSVLTEAAITGLVSSVIGLGLGVLAALGLQALLRGFGVTLPPGSLVFEPRTVLVGLAVGVGVTVVSAIGPARGAVRIPPVAALDDRQSRASAPLRRRLIWGTIVALAGAVLLGLGLAKPAIQLVGIGAAALFIGVATLSPAIARPLSSVIGRPLPRLLGVAGKLGRENSMRSPRRTAQTAAALMVGLALVSAMAVFGASLSKSATSSADQAISADLIVTATGSGELSNSTPAMVSAVPGVIATSAVLRRPLRVRQHADLARRGVYRSPGRHGDPADDRGHARPPWTTASCSSTPPPPPRSTCRSATRIAARFAGTGPTDAAHRRDLPGQRPDRQLPGQRRVLPGPLLPAAPGRRSCCAPPAPPQTAP